MPGAIITVPIANASDGIGAAPTGSKSMVRNDRYFMEKLAERWMKDQNRFQQGNQYVLGALPAGYSGYEHKRENTNHVDRYFYGHPNGIFRSLNELYPHFRHLMDHGGSVGCTCKLCSGTRHVTGSASTSNSMISSSPSESSRFFPGPSPAVQRSSTARKKQSSKGLGTMAAPPKFKKPIIDLPQGRLPSDPPASKRQKQEDEDGAPDYYRTIIDKLKSDKSGELQEGEITDLLSPDWRVTHNALQRLLSEWQSQANYVPRIGELVLFVKNASESRIFWEAKSGTFSLRSDSDSRQATWEAGVVTQLSCEPVGPEDLTVLPPRKSNVSYSGFRIEPLAEPSVARKQISGQHSYVPLHAIRPFALWKSCVANSDQRTWHPTFKHALTVASSLCVVGRYSFKGLWPDLTIFCRAAYLGAELLIVGDTVRLLPTGTASKVTDIMVITSIRLRFVNLDSASDDDYDNSRPYQSCVHIAGKAFTLEPAHAYPKALATPGENGLPESLAGYGQWYSMLDPRKPGTRLEVPFSRLLGKCYANVEMHAWFASATQPAFQAVNSKELDLSRGLSAIQQARQDSSKHDVRIDRERGKSWYLAETRIEQLDLHEVNDRFVGVKDENRTKKQVNTWRQALKLLDGKKGGLEEYNAAKKQREAEGTTQQATSGAWGMMGAASAQRGQERTTNEDDGEEEEDEEEEEDKEEVEGGESNGMEVDETVGGRGQNAALPDNRAGASIVYDLGDSEDESQEEDGGMET